MTLCQLLFLLLWMKLETVFGSVVFLDTVTALRSFASRLGWFRFPITNGGNVSAVRLDHIKDIQTFSILSVIDVVGNLELHGLAPAFKRLHDLR